MTSKIKGKEVKIPIKQGMDFIGVKPNAPQWAKDEYADWVKRTSPGGNRMNYQEITPINRSQAELHLKEGDIQHICETLVRLAYHESDIFWVQSLCLKFCSHSKMELRKVAITCLGHLARIHKKLELGLVNPILMSLLEDSELSGIVQDTLDDIEIFVPKCGKSKQILTTTDYVINGTMVTDLVQAIDRMCSVLEEGF
jgi:hypothetical protein